MAAANDGANYIGVSMRRKEDRRLLAGGGRYVDDLQFPDLLHAAFLRRPHAHALIRSLDLTAARAMPGVVAAVDGAAAAARLGPIPVRASKTPAAALRDVVEAVVKIETKYPIAMDRVRYVGEPL